MSPNGTFSPPDCAGIVTSDTLLPGGSRAAPALPVPGRASSVPGAWGAAFLLIAPLASNVS